ncbi:TatD family hydrolase [Candidatus Pacearchaeota archaeon]|nr:TatD family hydrolase [Candidatus Pacearchaeota archaeon]
MKKLKKEITKNSLKKEKLTFIDVHCHLDICENIDRIVRNANRKNVNTIITNGINPSNNKKVLDLAKKYEKEGVKAALGIYPIDALSLKDEEIDSELNFIRENREKISAIGEVGLDFKEDLTKREKQIKIFVKFIMLAAELNKPLIIHSRGAENQCIDMIERAGIRKVVMHHFSGDMNLVDKIAQNNWFLSIPSSIKYSEHFQNIVKRIEIENLLCETDAPFLNPFKTGQNEPVNVLESYKKIAEIKNMKIEDVAKKIKENYEKVFAH